jgi:hypothetical protein
MRRREFLAAAGAAVVTASAPQPLRAQQAAGRGAQQGIEIRTYRFASAEKQQAYAAFLEKTGIPALKRAGVASVGLFHMTKADNPQLTDMTADSTDLWMVLAHDSSDSVIELNSKLNADNEYQQAGKGILDTVKADAAFLRYASMLLLAFSGFPRVVPPPDKKDGRVLELRTYQSPNEERGINKMEMFNSGEIPIFARSGMPGVFWGKALVGPDLPQLTYMVCHESIDAAKKNWSAFGADPEWKTMREKPQYKDNVSTIIDRYLRPLPGSEI